MCFHGVRRNKSTLILPITAVVVQTDKDMHIPVQSNGN